MIITKRNSIKNIAIPVISILVLISLGAYNWKNNANFLDASLTNLLTLGVAVIISFHFVQRNTDRRKQKETLTQILKDVRDILADPAAYKIAANTPSKELTLRNRSISNRILLLKKYAKKFDIEEDILDIDKKFNEYSEIISDHFQNISELAAMSAELKRPLDLIVTRSYQAEITLYRVY